jgi:hypothetical protein
MSQIRLLALLMTLGGLSFYQEARAEESISEKGAATGKTVKRGAKKGWNRTKEAFCPAGDLECAKRKADNRLKETRDVASDKVKEAKNKVD